MYKPVSICEFTLLLVMILEHLKAGWIFWNLSYIFLIFRCHLFNFLLYIQLSCYIYNKLFRINLEFRHVNGGGRASALGRFCMGDDVGRHRKVWMSNYILEFLSRPQHADYIVSALSWRATLFYFIFESQFNNLKN